MHMETDITTMRVMPFAKKAETERENPTSDKEGGGGDIPAMWSLSDPFDIIGYDLEGTISSYRANNKRYAELCQNKPKNAA